MLLAHTALTLAMFAVLALAAGGVWIWRAKADRKRGVLMLAAAFVILVNVLIWTVPNAPS